MIDHFAETINDRLIFLFFQLIVAVGVSWIAIRKRFYCYPYEKQDKTSVALKDVCFVFLIFILIEVVFLPVAEHFWRYLGITLKKGWSPVFGVWLSLAGILGYFYFFSRETFRQVWSRGESQGILKSAKNYSFGLMSWFIVYPIVATIGQVLAIVLFYLYGAPEHDQAAVIALKQSLSDPLMFTCMAGSVIFLVPVIEELLFRGLLQKWLKQYFGRIIAIAFTSIIFALFHFSPDQGLSNIEFITALFILSCYLGFIYERQRSLWASIGLHSAFNAVSVLMIML